MAHDGGDFHEILQGYDKNDLERLFVSLTQDEATEFLRSLEHEQIKKIDAFINNKIMIYVALKEFILFRYAATLAFENYISLACLPLLTDQQLENLKILHQACIDASNEPYLKIAEKQLLALKKKFGKKRILQDMKEKFDKIDIIYVRSYFKTKYQINMNDPIFNLEELIVQLIRNRNIFGKCIDNQDVNNVYYFLRFVKSENKVKQLMDYINEVYSDRQEVKTQITLWLNDIE